MKEMLHSVGYTYNINNCFCFQCFFYKRVELKFLIKANYTNVFTNAWNAHIKQTYHFILPVAYNVPAVTVMASEVLGNRQATETVACVVEISRPATKNIKMLLQQRWKLNHFNT